MNGYVLAGGRSSRMGVDKARLPLDGWPAAVRLYERLAAAGLRPAIVRRGADGLPWRLPDGGMPRVVWEDPTSIRHPLQGVRTAALDAGAPFFVCPCDMIALSVASIRSLVQARAVAEGHPLAGVHLGADGLDAAIRAGRSVRAFVADRSTWSLPEAERVDRNHGGGPWSPEVLAGRVAHIRRVERDVVAAGERQRLRARGALVPGPSGSLVYAGPPTGGTDT